MEYVISNKRPKNGTFITRLSSSLLGVSEYVNGRLARCDSFGKFYKCEFGKFLTPFIIQPEATEVLKALVLHPEDVEDEDEKLIQEINKDLELIFPTDDLRTIKFSRKEFLERLK